MRSRPAYFLLWVPTLIVITVLACSDSTTEPEPESRPDPVAMTGSVDLPWEDGVLPLASLQLGFAGQTPALSDSGTFAFSAYPDGPGLLVAADGDGHPVLLSVVPRPAANGAALVDARSTALALLFMTPGITVSDPDEADAVLTALEATPGFGTLVDQVETALAEDPQGLAEENAFINQAMGTVINNYFGAILERHQTTADPTALRPLGEIVIDPSYEKGGLRVTWAGPGRYTMTNTVGRWALAVPSTDDGAFWIFPNGVLVDFLRQEDWRPFPPSKRDFLLSVALDDEETVSVYGIGFHPDADNLWSALTSEEKEYAVQAGVVTAMLEFVPHTLSMIGNAGRATHVYVEAGLTDTSLKFDSKIFKAVGLIMKNTRLIDRVGEYVEAGNLAGLQWFLTKEVLTFMSTNPDFHVAVAGLLGEKLASSATAAAISGLNRFAIFPVLLGNSYASVMKTVLGMGSSRYKTTFTVSHIISEFGNVSGTVHDKSSGEPLEGATVELLGEVNNPLNPVLTDVTNGSGAYFFENLTTGDKQVRASKDGYLSATVDVRVRADQTVTAPLIELGRPTGSAYGTVTDKILTDHNVQDDRFQKTLTLEAREIGGGTRVEIMVQSGEYDIDLTPGTYWLVARHEHYFPDSLQVTVTDGGSTAASRDLVMKPKGSMEGEILVDMNGDGTFETTVTVSAGVALVIDPSRTGGQTLMVSGGTGSQTGYDSIVLTFNLAEVDEPNAYSLGGSNLMPSAGVSVAASFFSSRFTCQPAGSGAIPLIFMTLDFSGSSDQAVCDCGVGFRGTVVVDTWGDDLTDPISGEVFSGELVGDRKCACICCEDTDGDGQDDDWVADCARARMNLTFTALVGSMPPVGP